MKRHSTTSCDFCGYELRGLKRGGVCPECGESIELSLQRFSFGAWTLGDRTWLNLIRAAVGMIIAPRKTLARLPVNLVIADWFETRMVLLVALFFAGSLITTLYVSARLSMPPPAPGEVPRLQIWNILCVMGGLTLASLVYACVLTCNTLAAALLRLSLRARSVHHRRSAIMPLVMYASSAGLLAGVMAPACALAAWISGNPVLFASLCGASVLLVLIAWFRIIHAGLRVLGYGPGRPRPSGEA